MKVNDLIEFLEYSPARAEVAVVVVGPDGQAVRHDSPLFLAEGDRVYLVIDQRTVTDGTPGTSFAERGLSDYERPQLFGHRYVLLPKADHAAVRCRENSA